MLKKDARLIRSIALWAVIGLRCAQVGRPVFNLHAPIAEPKFTSLSLPSRLTIFAQLRVTIHIKVVGKLRMTARFAGLNSSGVLAEQKRITLHTAQ